MFPYYLQLALRSFRRNKVITALMIITIAFGVAASMTTWAVFRAVSGDPITAKSSKLFFPQVDNWGPDVLGPNSRPPPATDYTRLPSLMRQLDLAGVVPGSVTTSLLVALGLLLVSLVNTAGLLLAKFTRRSGEIGVRRALGASRGAIYQQFLIEAGVIGLAGGVLGLVLTSLGVLGAHLVMPADVAALAHVSVPLLALTVLVAIVAAVVPGFYPAFRAAHVQPAWQIKVN